MDNKNEIPYETSQAFVNWAIVERALDPAYAQNMAWTLNKLMRQADIPFLTASDADKLAKIVMTNKDTAKSTKRNTLRAIEHYMDYLGRPDIHFKKPTAARKVPRCLTQDDMRKLARAVTCYRDFTIITVFSTTGLRLNELTSLDVGDLDFDRHLITVRTAKFDKEREVPMSEECESTLRDYLGRCRAKASRKAPLFLSQRGTRISNKAVQGMVQRAGQRAGLKNEISPHWIRHGFATAMLGNGCDLFHLSNLLGHSDIETTARYLHVLGPQQRAAFDAGVPKLH